VKAKNDAKPLASAVKRASSAIEVAMREAAAHRRLLPPLRRSGSANPSQAIPAKPQAAEVIESDSDSDDDDDAGVAGDAQVTNELFAASASSSSSSASSAPEAPSAAESSPHPDASRNPSMPGAAAAAPAVPGPPLAAGSSPLASIDCSAEAFDKIAATSVPTHFASMSSADRAVIGATLDQVVLTSGEKLPGSAEMARKRYELIQTE
jgi:hypothetical protein